MRPSALALLAFLALVVLHAPAAAQLYAAREAPVAYGHHHVNASDLDAHERFWAGALGGRRVQVGTSNARVIAFPNVLVFLAERAPTGGTKGTLVNHVGFEVRDIRAAVARLREGGFRMVTREELPASYDVVDDLGSRPGGNVVAFVMGPDETKVELLENPSIEHPIQLHHVHYSTPEGAAMQAWYAEHFGGETGTRIGQPEVRLPGVRLTFAPTSDPVAPTRGRALDHVGFEVKNLREVIARLEASGITMDRGYTEVASMGIAVAFLTDPWGTYIELTEGLAAVE
ncbi:MAG TPA: VOC family protein [Longimicrobiales bacterium]|nr:VOC family protein [Longimicrobiales bacterium]